MMDKSWINYKIFNDLFTPQKSQIFVIIAKETNKYYIQLSYI